MRDRLARILYHPASRLAMAVFWTALVAILTLLPGNSTVIEDTHKAFGGTDLSDALGHVVLFGILTLSYYWLLRLKFSLARALSIATIIVFAVGVGTEVAQMFVPERGPSPFDVAADWIGAGSFYVWARQSATRVENTDIR